MPTVQGGTASTIKKGGKSSSSSSSSSNNNHNSSSSSSSSSKYSSGTEVGKAVENSQDAEVMLTPTPLKHKILNAQL